MGETIVIPGRFNGPPTSGHGGYSCGIAGRLVDGIAAEVRLHRPPPLETPLEVVRAEDSVRLLHGDEVVAAGRRVAEVIDPLPPVSLAAATRAAVPAAEVVGHPFPTCFGCGPERLGDDGLRLFPGFVAEHRDRVACPLVIDRSLADANGVVPEEIVWAALDCPSAWAFHGGDLQRGVEELGVFVTGTIAASVLAPLHADEPYVIQGWTLGRDGRKLYSGSAIYTTGGVPVACCRQTWIVLRPAEPGAT